MSDSVFALMKAAAERAIPRYQGLLAGLEASVLASLSALLRQELPQASPRLQAYLAAIGSDRHAEAQLSNLETEDIVMLHEAIQRCWNKFSPGPQQRAIQHLYQLVAAHFFVYHVRA